MSRRQYLILLAFSIPLVTVLDLPGAMRAMWGTSTPAVPDVSTSRQATPILDRVAILADEPLDDVKMARRSDSFPDVELTDQFGQNHLFRRDLIRDRIVCVMFFYSQCTGTCPGTIQMVSHLRQAAKDQFADQDVQFVAITLDPEHDTPEVLKEYADARGILPDESMPEWLFCTGRYEDLELIRRSLGLYDRDPVVDADRTQHAALVVFGNDKADRWTAQPSGLGSNDLVETFFRITGTSERQRFSHRIGRSDQFMKTSAGGPASAAGYYPTLQAGDAACRKNPSECCSLPDAKR
jgi:protein SCO1/2